MVLMYVRFPLCSHPVKAAVEAQFNFFGVKILSKQGSGHHVRQLFSEIVDSESAAKRRANTPMVWACHRSEQGKPQSRNARRNPD